MSGPLEIVPQGRILQFILNRPEKRNALNRDLCRSLADAIAVADRDPDVGVILLTARGKVFCAGMDLEEVSAGPSPELDPLHERLFTIGISISTPIVAAVEGAALGGGAGLVANCHIAIASPESTFGLTEIRLGLWPFLIYRAILAAIGERRALEMALTGRICPADEAREIGLVHEVSQSTEERALHVAAQLAAASPTAVREGLRFAREVRTVEWARSGEIAARFRSQVFQTADFEEGVRAFREKRAPRWPSLGRPPHDI